MEFQDTIKSLKVNIKKKINTIVLVVEGASYEFSLFNQIFRKLLHYKLVTKSRNQNEFKEYNEFVDILNQASKVFKNRQNESINEYKELLNKKENGQLVIEIINQIK